MQTCTQRYDRRPYGVGLLVAGYDVSKLFKTYYICLFNKYLGQD